MVFVWNVETQNSQFTVQTFLLKDMKGGKIWGVLTWRGKSEVNGEEAQTCLRLLSLVRSKLHYTLCVVYMQLL